MTECPIAFERMVDACAGELSEAEEQDLEEHVFACDACGAAYARVSRLVGALRTHVPPVISHERLARLQASGSRLRITPVPAGARVEVWFGPEVDLLVHALHGDIADAERIDVGLETIGGERLTTFEDVAFDRTRGQILIACQRHYAELGFPNELRFRVHAHTRGGIEVVGDYVVDHRF